jgi:hypothetical protein
MEIWKKGLPIHKDAQLKIRARIFLEGNFFVDLQPGSPSEPTIADGGHIPVQQTATPVQFGQVLTALQADTRKDLQTFLHEYAVEGLGNGGAEAYNKGLDSAPEAFRYAAIANQATLGLEEHDLSKLLRGQQRLFKALSARPEVLKSLVENLNITANAFAREESALAATIPALRDVLRVGRPALISLNDMLPSLRAFARDALPGVRSTGPTIDASMPFIRQLRLLVRPQELQGLARDLRFAIPDLARVNRSTIGLLDQNRALSACTNNVLRPFSRTPVPDPDFENRPNDGGANGQPFYKEAPRGLVGLAGESRLSDASTPLFHVQFGSGPANALYQNEGDNFIAQTAHPPEGVRPIKPDHRPVFRPGTPCEKQEKPDLHAAGGGPDQTVLADGTELIPGLPLPDTASANKPLPSGWKTRDKQEELRLINQVQDYLKLKMQGVDLPQPLLHRPKQYEKVLEQVGFHLSPQGHILKGAVKKKAAKKKAGIGAAK